MREATLRLALCKTCIGTHISITCTGAHATGLAPTLVHISARNIPSCNKPPH